MLFKAVTTFFEILAIDHLIARDPDLEIQLELLFSRINNAYAAIMRQADALVIASPVYWFTVSAQTKLFIDRCYALGGGDPSRYALTGKQVGIVLTYGDSDPFNSGAVNALRTFQDTYNYIGAEIVGMIYGSADHAGDVRQNDSLMAEAKELGVKIGSSG